MAQIFDIFFFPRCCCRHNFFCSEVQFVRTAGHMLPKGLVCKVVQCFGGHRKDGRIVFLFHLESQRDCNQRLTVILGWKDDA